MFRLSRRFSFPFQRTLYGQLSFAFLTSLLTYGGCLSLAAYFQISGGFEKARQILQWHTADFIAQEIEDAVTQAHSSHAAFGQLLRFQQKSPFIDAYILDSSGRIEVAFPSRPGFASQTIDLNPIHKFLEPGSKGKVPIYGEDPRGTKRAIVSVARLNLHGEPFYLYLVLGNQTENSLAQVILDQALISSGSIAMLAATLLTVIAGLASFFVIIRPFRAALRVIVRYQAGDYALRLPAGQNNEMGILAGALNSLGDAITSQIRELARKERLRKELVSNVAHDLRGPLHLIRAGIEKCATIPKTTSDPDLSELLSSLDLNAAMLGKLLTELFELSQLEARDITPKLAPVEIDCLVEDLVIRFKQRAKIGGIVLRTDFEGALPPVMCDPTLIERALSNLVENALRYIPPAGHLIIGAAHDENFVSIRVTDTGCGIAPDELSQVFDRRYQSARREKGVAGLGLAIVERIVEVHGSTIEVVSEPGQGTTFSFRLPICDTPASPNPNDQAHPLVG